MPSAGKTDSSGTKLHIELVSRRTVIIEDQISLLKGAAFEMMQIRFNIVFDTATNQWKCGNIIYCIHDAFRGETTKTLAAVKESPRPHCCLTLRPSPSISV